MSFNRIAFNAIPIAICRAGLLSSVGKGLVDQAFQRVSMSLDRRSLSSIYFSGRYFHPCRRRRRWNWRLQAKVNTESLRSLSLSLSLSSPLSLSFFYSSPSFLPPSPSIFHHLFTLSKTRRNLTISNWGIRVFRLSIWDFGKIFIFLILEVNEIAQKIKDPI